MAIVPGFTNDIFVSYSHIDNAPMADGRGWVDVFHEHLQNFVNVHLGRRISVWRDKRLHGGEIFSDEIEQQLRASAVLVSVLSPGYVNSTWCNRELLGFTDTAQKQGRLRVGNLPRVQKVLRLPVDAKVLPELIDQFMGTNFYRFDEASQRVRDLLLDDDPRAMQIFRARVDDVAQYLARLIDAMANPAIVPAPPRGRVFVAWCTADVAVEREMLLRELSAKGWQVLPDGPMPLDSQALRAAVEQALQGTQLAVHLLGRRYGVVPEGEDSSVVQLQCEAATAPRRVLWIGPDELPREARMAAWLERLRREPPPGCDLLERQSVEALKTLVLARLEPRPDAPAAGAAQGAAAPLRAADAAVRIYLVCDSADTETVAPLVDRLFDAGYEVSLPLFDADDETTRREHLESLREVDGVLTWWGNGGEGWLRAILRDLERVAGLGRQQPFAARLLAVGAPANPAKQRFRTRELPVVAVSDVTGEEWLRNFLAELPRPAHAAK